MKIGIDRICDLISEGLLDQAFIGNKWRILLYGCALEIGL